MDSIISMYNTVNRKAPASASELSYIPHRFYIDPLEIRKEKEKQASMYMKDKPKRKLNLKVKKGTFLEEIERR